ncbi:response regulator transcription factor [Corynebacterium pilosum]
MAGESNTRIARKLHISVSTVKKHLVELFRVFEVESRVQLVVAAQR